MGGKQSVHNDISPTKLNSIHHKEVINTNKVERIDSTDYNTSCNCEMRWDGGGDGVDVGDDIDDDLDDGDDDDDDNGDDLPFREEISLAESARRRWLFLLCRFPPRGGGETLLVLGGNIVQRRGLGVGPGSQEGTRRALGGA